VAIKKLLVWNRQKVSELGPRKKSRIFAEKMRGAYFTFPKSTDIRCL
jgi:hypothetical protein